MALSDLWVIRTKKPVGRDLPGSQMDILAYLESEPQQRAPLKKLGMALKDPEIVSEVASLSSKGYIMLMEPKAYWKCLACGTLNPSAKSDPRRVQCSACSTQFTVTGRHIDGTLMVQKFSVR